MKVKLYNAISLDGFIARKDGDSDWVSETDWPVFESEMQKAGCIIVGRKTFEQFLDELYPVEGVTNIVLTTDEGKEKEEGNVVYTAKSPSDVLELAKSKGYDTCLLIGGGNANASFIEKNLIDEVMVTVHPLILGDGIRLFESSEVDIQLERIETKELDEGLVQIIYKVKK